MDDNSILPRSVFYGYGFGHIFNDFCASMWFTYLLLYYKAVLEFSSSYSGIALATGQAIDGIATIIVGILIDRKSNHWIFKYGQRKTWHLVGTMCVLVSFPFIFSPAMIFKNSGDLPRLLYYCTFIAIFQFGWASVQISNLSIVPRLTHYEYERMRLYNLRYSCTVIANLFVYTTFCILFKYYDTSEELLGPQNTGIFQIVAWTVTIIGTITSALYHIFVEEEIDNPCEERRGLLKTPQLGLSSIFSEKKLYILTIVYVCTRLFANLNQTFTMYYLHDYLKLASFSLGILSLVGYLSSFLASTVISPLSAELGKYTMHILGSVFGILASVWIFFGRSEDNFYRYYEIYGVVVAFGIASAILLVTSLSMTADYIGPNTQSGSTIYGFLSTCDKFSNGIIIMIAESLDGILKYPGYSRDMLVISCSLSAALSIPFIYLLKLGKTSH